MEFALALYERRKIFLACLLVLIFLLEIRANYFKGVKPYLAKQNKRVYGVLFLALIVLTLFMMALDSFILERIQVQNSGLARNTVLFGDFLAKYCWQIAGAVYFLFYLIRADKSRRAVFSALFSSLLTAAAVTVFKFTVLRARPNADLGPHSFLNLAGIFGDDSSFQSFSSGDTALVAGFACYFIFLMRNYFFKGVLFLLPLASAFTRIYLDKHWPSDTFFSIGLGLMAAKLVWDYQNKPGNCCSVNESKFSR